MASASSGIVSAVVGLVPSTGFGGAASLLVAVACVTAGSLLLLNHIAPRLGLVDRPDPFRKRNFRAVPLTGGLAVLSGVVWGAVVVGIPVSGWIAIALLAAVALVHTVDDVIELSPRLRLVFDGAIALGFAVLTGSVIETMGQLGPFNLELGLLAVPMTVLSFLTLSNAFNMIDGTDGLMFSQGLISVCGLAIWAVLRTPGGDLDPMIAILGTALLVVLVANLGLLGPRMKCFAGDCGARLIGFFLVYAMIAQTPEVLSQIQGVYFVALPLMDICAVTVERLRDGQSPVTPDRRHLHHLLIDAGWSRWAVVWAMGGVSVAFAALAIWQALSGWDTAASFATFMMLATVYWMTRRSVVLALARVARGGQFVGPAE